MSEKLRAEFKRGSHLDDTRPSHVINELLDKVEKLQADYNKKAEMYCTERDRANALQSQLQEARAEIGEWKNRYSEETNLASYARKCWHDEAGNLKAQVARLQGELKEMASIANNAHRIISLRERQLEISKEQRDHFIKRGNVPNNAWIIRSIEQCDLELAALEAENEKGEM